MCDADCKAVFTKHKVLIYYKGDIALEGTRCPDTNLWLLPLSPQQQANASVALPSKAPDLIKFSHATLFSPSLSTLQEALKDNSELEQFPGLTLSSLNKYPPVSMPMHQGHLDQTRANQRSTKPKLNSDEPLKKGTCSNSCYTKIVEFEPKHQTHSDLTGKFPVTSKSGNKYTFVLCDYDSNHIFVRPLKNRNASTILDAHKAVMPSRPQTQASSP